MRNEPENCKSIEDVRFEIDSIDNESIRLIALRGSYVKAAAKFKTDTKSVKAEDRVKSMIEIRRQWAIEQDINPDFIESQFRAMVQYFINLEMEEWKSKN
jgi:isochorismate pyruvate lyase